MLDHWLALAPLPRLALSIYVLAMLGLCAFGVHRYSLVWRAFRRRARANDRAEAAPTLAVPVPFVTVQLPLYNERHVVQRLLTAVSALDWPRGRLEIQVLDDSDDETRTHAAELVAELKTQGVPIAHHHRSRRHGFKAGALAAGESLAAGEFLAVFDADFVPPADFLRLLVPHFADPEVGMVQARWGHLNRAESPLTEFQAALLDGHFLIDQVARANSNHFFNFNGTAGIWRRTAVRDAGGWQTDTLTEDLDLSYRAQLRGWRFKYLPAVVVPAELPSEIDAFKAQQHRWSEGSIQTARKLLPRIATAKLPFCVRIEAFAHLLGNLAYPLLLLLAIVAWPALEARNRESLSQTLFLELPFFLLGSLPVIAFYTLGRAIPGRRPWLGIPLLLALGAGMAVNNGVAALAGLLRPAGEFRRTPKKGGTPVHSGYSTRRQPWFVVELALGMNLFLATISAISDGLWLSVPFLFLLASGFSTVGLLTLAGNGLRRGTSRTTVTSRLAPASEPPA